MRGQAQGGVAPRGARALLLALLLAAPARQTRGQEPPPPTDELAPPAADQPTDDEESAGKDGGKEGPTIAEKLGGSSEDPRALEAFDLLQNGNLIKAREMAEKLLKDNPDSFEAHYLIGTALHRAEGDLPTAFYHLTRARKLFERLHGKTPSRDTPWLWHASTLNELATVAGEMDRWQERIADLEAHDEAYSPTYPAERGWAYMRLRDYDAARVSVAAGLASDDMNQRGVAHTTLCAIEFESQHREEAYTACTDAVAFDEGQDESHPHTLTNAALAALALLKMDEAERLLQEATKHFDDGSPTNPWVVLVDLYVAQRRAPEALEAVREMQAWRGSQLAYLDEQTWAEAQFAAALFLVSVGRAEDAVRITRRILDRPDRTGFISSDSSLNEAGNALLHRLACRVSAERLAEQASWSTWRGWLTSLAAARKLRLESWEAGRRAAALVDRERILVATLRPHLAGCLTIPDWMDQELCEVLGPGVILAGLDRARAEETLPNAGGYFDALAAEALYEKGSYRDALKSAGDALGRLPEAEVTLRARLHAVAGAAALALGQEERAEQELDMAMQKDPGVMRMLGLALPTSFEASDGVIPRYAAKLLRGSPRFVSGSAFTVKVDGNDDTADACLTGLSGRVLACATVTRKQNEAPAEVARRLAAELHEQAFAPRVDLTQEDIRSLDGSTANGSAKLKLMLDELTGKPAATTKDP